MNAMHSVYSWRVPFLLKRNIDLSLLLPSPDLTKLHHYKQSPNTIDITRRRQPEFQVWHHTMASLSTAYNIKKEDVLIQLLLYSDLELAINNVSSNIFNY